MSTRDALIEQATRLPATERLELVDRILESLDETDPAIDRLWTREAAERLAAYRRGEVAAIPLSTFSLPDDCRSRLAYLSVRSNNS